MRSVFILGIFLGGVRWVKNSKGCQLRLFSTARNRISMVTLRVYHDENTSNDQCCSYKHRGGNILAKNQMRKPQTQKGRQRCYRTSKGSTETLQAFRQQVECYSRAKDPEDDDGDCCAPRSARRARVSAGRPALGAAGAQVARVVGCCVPASGRKTMKSTA